MVFIFKSVFLLLVLKFKVLQFFLLTEMKLQLNINIIWKTWQLKKNYNNN